MRDFLDRLADEPTLVVRVEDLEVLRQPGLLPVRAQQAMRNEMKRSMQAKGEWISADDIGKLEKLSTAIIRAIEALKRSSDLASELSSRLTAEQLLEAAIKKVEAQDLATLNYAIRRLRAHRDRTAARDHVADHEADLAIDEGVPVAHPRDRSDGGERVHGDVEDASDDECGDPLRRDGLQLLERLLVEFHGALDVVHAVERGNRRYRKMQKSVYRVRTQAQDNCAPKFVRAASLASPLDWRPAMCSAIAAPSGARISVSVNGCCAKEARNCWATKGSTVSPVTTSMESPGRSTRESI